MHRIPPSDRDGTPAAPAAESAPAGPQNLAMRLAYDGSAFQGWQIQARGPTIQGALEAALHTITRQPVKVYGAGRTDAGVHALGQVANFQLPALPDLHRLRGQLNGLAGPAIVVQAIAAVPPHFHARHRAWRKHYRYRLFNQPYPPAFGRGHTWWVRQRLDLDAMRAAAAHLPGQHDFSAFRSRHCEAPNPVRTLYRLELAPHDEPDCTLAIELEANAFLQHMARIVVGTLVEVGVGRLAPHAVAEILASGKRHNAAATAPPGGLHLVSVKYDPAAFPELQGWWLPAPAR